MGEERKIDIFTISRQLMDDEVEDDVKALAIKPIKDVFSSSLKNLSVESLLMYVESLQTQSLSILGNKELFVFGKAVVDVIGRRPSFDPNLFHQLEVILSELKTRMDKNYDKLASLVWIRFSQKEIEDVKAVKMLLKASNIAIEGVVLSWLENPSEMQYYVNLSSVIPELYQSLTAILHCILVKMEGHDTILELVKTFVVSVMSVCQNNGKNFLKLYPSDCCRLVSLLSVPSFVYPKDANKSPNRAMVLEQILKSFETNKNRTLLLLSHYPEWVVDFKIYVKENGAHY